MNTHELAGVGAIVGAPRRLIEVTHITDEFTAALESGRIACHAFNLHGAQVITVYTLHGYSGGNQKPERAARTRILTRAIDAEIKAQPKGPTMIVGDFNIDVKKLQSFADLLPDEHWMDLGANAHLWNQPSNEHTCLTATEEAFPHRLHAGQPACPFPHQWLPRQA